MSFMNFLLLTHLTSISPRPILFVVGDDAHSRYSSEDAYEAAAEPRELYTVPNAGHVDLYDKTDLIPFDKLDEFFTENLPSPSATPPGSSSAPSRDGRTRRSRGGDVMRAIGLFDYGGPEVLQQLELPEPHAGAGQVRIKVRAAAINPADVMLREGLLDAFYEGIDPPFVPGMDIAGTIDEVGEGVSEAVGAAIGEDVVAIVSNRGSHGGYTEYVVLPGGVGDSDAGGGNLCAGGVLSDERADRPRERHRS